MQPLTRDQWAAEAVRYIVRWVVDELEEDLISDSNIISIPVSSKKSSDGCYHVPISVSAVNSIGEGPRSAIVADYWWPSSSSDSSVMPTNKQWLSIINTGDAAAVSLLIDWKNIIDNINTTDDDKDNQCYNMLIAQVSLSQLL